MSALREQDGVRRAAGADGIRPLVLRGAAIGVPFVALVVGVVVWRILPDWTTPGQFGDMFGVVNALFSGAALVGVIYAVLLQRRELQLQRQELELTRRELERTVGAQEQSAHRLLEQTRIQTQLLSAQLVKDRLALYWETYTPVTAEQVSEFNLYPEDYMEVELYESLATRETKMRFDATSRSCARGFVILLLAWCSLCLAACPPSAQEPTAAARSSNAFACDLYRELAAGEGNLLFSPVSIHLGMAMAYAGARGETAGQMATAMYYPAPPREIATALGPLQETLDKPRLLPFDKRPAYALSIANALWVARDCPLGADFARPLRERLGARLEAVDFSRTEAVRVMINAWVSQETRERIQDVIGPGVITARTRLVLTNAVYFKSGWSSAFSESDTHCGPFHVSADRSVDGKLMEKLAHFGYLETGEMQGLGLGYMGGDVSMFIFLPKETDGLPELEQQISAARLEAWLDGFTRTRVRVILPKFEYTSALSLGDALHTLGVVDAFVPELADFTGMTPAENLAISAGIHKAFIAVDENGTEAAAATSGVIGLIGSKADPEVPKVFRADHPFLFLIRHRETGAILFMGRVTNPVG